MGYMPYDASRSIEWRQTRRRMRLVTASCGFSKDDVAADVSSSRRVFKQGMFGDDACFVAKFKGFDVLGE